MTELEPVEVARRYFRTIELPDLVPCFEFFLDRAGALAAAELGR